MMMKNLLGITVFTFLAVVCGMLLWLGRASADPCFMSAAKKVACPGVTVIYCSNFNYDQNGCVDNTENDLYLNTFICGGVADKTNCNPVLNINGGAALTPCYDVYFCYWDEWDGCYMVYDHTVNVPYMQTDKC